MISAKLNELGLILPQVARPVAAYIPAKRTSDIVYVSGQLPIKDGDLMIAGPLTSQADVEKAKQAMVQCFLNAIAAATTVVGINDLSGVLRIAAFVASAPSFTWQHLVANGASELAGEIFGEQGRHSRSAIGVPSLPLNASVELEVQFLV
ncbi:MAG: RidA family protein, partial [Leptonema sp. (in: Bacteria)]|nr:RidA family protein [Leptonema sp. (in: bacteria)]